MRLLVVEDEPALCQSIAEGLRLDGYEVDTCGDGQEALELCCVERFALILLDLSLPGLDGMELLRHLRAEDAENSGPDPCLPEASFRIKWMGWMPERMII